MRKKNAKHSKERKSNLYPIILLICVALMIYSGFKIYDWWQENQKNKNILEEVKQEVNIDNNKEVSQTEKYNVDIKALKQTNSDVKGWVKVWGTDVEFPVVQTTNNEYYLTHSLDKSYNSAGWAFIDYTNKLDGTDENIVIYGHNRRDNSMFATLKNVLEADWYENKTNLYIPFIQENSSSMYEVFSVYSIEQEDYYTKTNFSNLEEYKTFLEKIKNRSIKDFGVQVNENDKVLTLSTCADNNKYRVVLHAKKI